jgi:hypothetical protein
MLHLHIPGLTTMVQVDTILDDSANLTLRAIERDDGNGTMIFWTVLSVVAVLIIVAVIISIWKAPDEVKALFWTNTKGQAENLFLPVSLQLFDPESCITGSLPPEKVYLRSLGFRGAVLLTEHALGKGQELWISVKGLPYFHGKRDQIHGRLVSSRKLGEHWYTNRVKIVHEGREADEELSGFIRDLRAVPG